MHNGSSKTQKKHFWQKFLAFLNAFYPKTHLSKYLNSPDSSRPYGRLLQNLKARSSRDLFLLENDFQNSSTKDFPKKHSDFGGLEANWRHEIQT